MEAGRTRRDARRTAERELETIKSHRKALEALEAGQGGSSLDLRADLTMLWPPYTQQWDHVAATLVGLGTDELGPRFSTFYRPGVASND